MTNEAELTISRLGQVAVGVTDLGRAVAFYRDILGAQHVATFDPPGLAFFDLEGTRLLLDQVAAEYAGAGLPLYFRVDDLEAAVAALRARGATLEHDPQMIHRDETGVLGAVGIETWMAFFRDPDGNVLALMSEVLPGS